jgi:hypothetical protein
VVVFIEDIEVSCRVERNVAGGDLRLSSRATVAREARPMPATVVIVPEGSIFRTRVKSEK